MTEPQTQEQQKVAEWLRNQDFVPDDSYKEWPEMADLWRHKDMPEHIIDKKTATFFYRATHPEPVATQLREKIKQHFLAYAHKYSSHEDYRNPVFVEYHLNKAMEDIAQDRQRILDRVEEAKPIWAEYTGDYKKQYYDIKLWSGEIYENCWPNANTFHEGVIGKVILGKDVAYIRVSDNEALARIRKEEL